MKEVKCYWCKNASSKDNMHVEEKGTGKYNKNGTEKKTRKYFHHDCYKEFLMDKENKEKELRDFDKLYQYILKLHNFKTLDVRMIEKIQDLRNGTIKINNKKVKRYKSGVSYKDILNTYIYMQEKIERVLHTKTDLESSWNQFSYVFGIVQKNINDVKHMNEQKHKQEQINSIVQSNKLDIYSEESGLQSKQSTKRKDELDISDFL